MRLIYPLYNLHLCFFACLLSFQFIEAAKQPDFLKKFTSYIHTHTNKTPGEVLNIGLHHHQNHFELQLARSGEEKIKIYSLEQIAHGFEEDPYFIVVPHHDHDAVQFWVQVDAPTTPHSSFPRTELRQVRADGSKTSFDPFFGTHILQGKTRITHLPPVKPEVVIAQLFDGSSDRVAIRTQLIKGKINLVVRVNGKVVHPYLSTPYHLNTEFEWKIHVQHGLASIYYNDMETPIIANQILEGNTTPTWYFKAGCYSQTNSSIEDNPNEYVSVELRDLHCVQH